MIGRVARTSKDMPTQVVVPTATVAMPVGRGDATTGLMMMPSNHRAVLTNMLEDAVRRYVVKGTNNADLPEAKMRHAISMGIMKNPSHRT